MLELTPGIARYNFPTPIDFGVGARQKIVDELKARSLSRPLIVTDQFLSKLVPVTGINQMLEDAGLSPGIFDGVAGNPVKSQVLAGAEAFHQHGADAIVAIGGGAPVDVAKAIALMVYHPGDLFDYEDGKVDAPPVDKEIPYLVAVPTTAGTGSEVGRSAVVSDDESHIKKIIFSPRLLPEHVFADPELLLGLPAKLTAATGMDALTHLVEAYVAKGYHPMCDGIALEGIRLVQESLQLCVDYANSGEGSTDQHLAARSWMLNASIMGAVAFQKGLGVTHSCAHALSTVCDLHHGLANGIMVPFAMAFNQEAVPEKFKEMAAAAGLSDDGFVDWLDELREGVGIPKYLSAVGVSAEHLDSLVDHAMADPCHQLNPRAVSREEMRAIFVQALGQEE